MICQHEMNQEYVLTLNLLLVRAYICKTLPSVVGILEFMTQKSLEPVIVIPFSFQQKRRTNSFFRISGEIVPDSVHPAIRFNPHFPLS